MKLHSLLVSIILFSSSIVVCAQPQTIEIDATNVGSYILLNGGFIFGPTPNYIAGNAIGDPSRNFFVFDLTGFSGDILTAEIVAFNPDDADPTRLDSCGYADRNIDPTEDYKLSDVVTSIDNLLDGSTPNESFEDLGEGSIYAERTFSVADNGQTITMILNANAIEDINNSIGSRFALGGRVTTLMNDDPPPGSYDLIFGCSFLNDPNNVPFLPKLRVTFAPDSDNDGVLDDIDNCPNNINPGQGNADRDSRGGACDNNDNASDEPFNCIIDNDL